MKYLLLGLILTVISVYCIIIYLNSIKNKNKESLITDINFEAQKANDNWYFCPQQGTSYATYNAATLTPAQKALAKRSYPERPEDYYACKQGCEDVGAGKCVKYGDWIMSRAGRLAGWINPWGRRLNSTEIKTNQKNFIN